MSDDARPRNAGFATRAIHLGYDPTEYSGALTPPVFMTSTYAFETAEEAEALFLGERQGYIYGRTRNPTQALLEERLASLEGAEAGLAVASGIAAISSTIWSILKSGDQVLIDHTLYGNTFGFFVRGLPRFGVNVEVADFTDLEAVEAALSELTPKIVFCESPGNPTLRIVDISALANMAHRIGALLIVDNTFATPALQQPLRLGADLVVHSATKYIGGHGDLIAGAVLGSKGIVETIRREALRFLTGATIAPLTAFLLLRGLKTLELRMERHSSSALAIAKLLEQHAALTSVFYPGLANSPFHELASRQMSAFGGLVACELRGGKKAAKEFMNRVTLASRAVSLGDAETLVQHPASMTHSTYTPEERERHGISDGLIRLSIGLETLDDIKSDIKQALDAVCDANKGQRPLAFDDSQ
jgi:methionine-gamma-lyase